MSLELVLFFEDAQKNRGKMRLPDISQEAVDSAGSIDTFLSSVSNFLGVLSYSSIRSASLSQRKAIDQPDPDVPSDVNSKAVITLQDVETGHIHKYQWCDFRALPSNTTMDNIGQRISDFWMDVLPIVFFGHEIQGLSGFFGFLTNRKYASKRSPVIKRRG